MEIRVYKELYLLVSENEEEFILRDQESDEEFCLDSHEAYELFHILKDYFGGEYAT